MSHSNWLLLTIIRTKWIEVMFCRRNFFTQLKNTEKNEYIRESRIENRIMWTKKKMREKYLTWFYLLWAAAKKNRRTFCAHKLYVQGKTFADFKIGMRKSNENAHARNFMMCRCCGWIVKEMNKQCRIQRRMSFYMWFECPNSHNSSVNVHWTFPVNTHTYRIYTLDPCTLSTLANKQTEKRLKRWLQKFYLTNRNNFFPFPNCECYPFLN